MSVGFTEWQLLNGSDVAQYITSGTNGGDTVDDITCIGIGFDLYHKHGAYAETLTATDILDALATAPSDALLVSRTTHWCESAANKVKNRES